MSDYEFEACKHFALKCIFKERCVLVGEEECSARCSEIIRFINILGQNSNHLENLKIQINCPRRSGLISLHSCLRNQFVGPSGCQGCQQPGKNILEVNDLIETLPPIEEEIRIKNQEKYKGFTVSEGPNNGNFDDNEGGY